MQRMSLPLFTYVGGGRVTSEIRGIQAKNVSKNALRNISANYWFTILMCAQPDDAQN